MTGNEVAAAMLVEGNALVFADGNNTPTVSQNHFSLSFGKTYTNIGGYPHEVEFQVHTHPRYSEDPRNPLGISPEDRDMAKRHFNGYVHIITIPDHKFHRIKAY